MPRTCMERSVPCLYHRSGASVSACLCHRCGTQWTRGMCMRPWRGVAVGAAGCAGLSCLSRFSSASDGSVQLAPRLMLHIHSGQRSLAPRHVSTHAGASSPLAHVITPPPRTIQRAGWVGHTHGVRFGRLARCDRTKWKPRIARDASTTRGPVSRNALRRYSLSLLTSLGSLPSLSLATSSVS